MFAIRAMDNERIESWAIFYLENLKHRIFIERIRSEAIDGLGWNRDEKSTFQERAGFCNIFADFCGHALFYFVIARRNCVAQRSNSDEAIPPYSVRIEGIASSNSAP